MLYIISWSQPVELSLSLPSSCACRLLEAVLAQVSEHFTACCVLVGTTLGQQPGKVWGHWLHLSSSFGAEQWPEGKC